MGDVILQRVLALLRQAGIPVGRGYPGGAMASVTEPVAAVRLEKVDTGAMTATIRVEILAPAKLGGAACEELAQKVLDVLQAAGGDCVQRGCEYLALAQMYQVDVDGVFSWAPVEEEENWFEVVLAGVKLPRAVELTAQRTENDPDDGGGYLWKLQLTEEIPAADDGDSGFHGGDTLVLEGAGERVTFTGCQWTDIRWKYGKDGLRRVWIGTAGDRSVKKSG